MRIGQLRELLATNGFLNFVRYVVIALVNRILFFRVLVGMALHKDSLSLALLEVPTPYTTRFLRSEEVLELSKDASLDLPIDFVKNALAKGDRCYGVLDGDRVASYGWYSNTPTYLMGGCWLSFNPQYTYMYRGFTKPEYRGQRLHAVGMARAMMELIQVGSHGLISYVENTNFSSLNSVTRMGYEPFGRVVIVKLGTGSFSWLSPGCKKYLLRVTPVGGSIGGTERACKKRTPRILHTVLNWCRVHL